MSRSHLPGDDDGRLHSERDDSNGRASGRRARRAARERRAAAEKARWQEIFERPPETQHELFEWEAPTGDESLDGLHPDEAPKA